jgi:transcriptional regulator with XRE-family HTH domain
MEKMNIQDLPPQPLQKFATEEEPFHFVDSGLDNIYLIGIKYFVDGEGNISAEIPAGKQLMRLIARDIVTSPLDLTGKEIRFLRKRLGKKAIEYCTYLGFSPETLSRIENGKQAISIQSQKLARLSYCAFSEDPELIDCARTVLQSILEEIQTKKKKSRLILQINKNQQWRELKAA